MLALSPYINIGSGHVLFLKSKNFANNIDLGGWGGGGVWGRGGGGRRGLLKNRFSVLSKQFCPVLQIYTFTSKKMPIFIRAYCNLSFWS